MADCIRIVVASLGANPHAKQDANPHAGQDANPGARQDQDGHDPVQQVARALRDAGVEVVYAGPDQTPEQLVHTVVQEDADAIWVSVSGRRPGTTLGRTAELLAENEASDVMLFAGATVPEREAAELRSVGVAKVFGPGVSTDEIVAWVHTNVGARSVT